MLRWIKTKNVEGENSVEFPIFEIEDSSDENVITKESHPKETTITGNDFKLRRSSRNVGPPQLYGKSWYIDIIDENDNQPGSSKTPYHWTKLTVRALLHQSVQRIPRISRLLPLTSNRKNVHPARRSHHPQNKSL